MGSELSPVGSTNTADIGQVPGVDFLSRPATPSAKETGSAVAAEPAGLHDYRANSTTAVAVDALFGRSAPTVQPQPQSPKPSGKAEDLGPKISVGSSYGTTPGVGSVWQSTVSVSGKIDDTTLAGTMRFRGRDFINGKGTDSTDARLTLRATPTLKIDDKLTVSPYVEGYVQTNLAGPQRLEVGGRFGLDVKYNVSGRLAVGGGIYLNAADITPGSGAVVAGGRGFAQFKPSKALTLTAGIEGETPNLLAPGGKPNVAAYFDAAAKINDSVSLSARYTRGIDGANGVGSFPGSGRDAFSFAINFSH
jgi:hypothetical protein